MLLKSETEIASLYRVLYGHKPSQVTTQLLKSRGVTSNGSARRTMRKIIGALDRQTYPTPFNIRFSEHEIRFLNVEGIEIAIDEADIAVGGFIAWAGNYEPHVCNLLRKVLLPGMTVLDIGANIGFYSMLAAELVGPQGRVVAFEPNSENCRLLTLSARRSQRENVKLFPVGLADRAGACFFSPALGSNGQLLPSNHDSLLSENCTVIPVFRLDDVFAERVDFIKIDTEGAEGMIMKGAQQTLAHHKPLILSEFSPEMLNRVSGIPAADYLSAFECLGYTLHIVTSTQAPDSVTAEQVLARHSEPGLIDDIVLVPREKLDWFQSRASCD